MFSFIAVQVGVPIWAVSVAILVFLLFYLVSNYQRAIWLFQKRTIFLWVVFVFAWPLLTVPYAPVFDIKAIAFNFYMVSLLLATAIWATQSGIERVGKLLGFSAAAVIFGLALSLVAPDFFAAVAEAANAHASYKNRAFGFYMQPNMAAENMAFMFALLLLTLALRSIVVVSVSTIVFVVAVMVTGSRGGMIIAMVLLVYAFLFSSSPAVRAGRGGTAKKIAGVSAIVIAVVLVSQIIELLSGGGAAASGEAFTLSDRIRAVLTLDFKSGGLIETAVGRYIALQEHWAGIVSNPVLGQGIAASHNLAASGSLSYASHNQYLQVAFDFGIPVLLLYLYLILDLWRNADGDLAQYLTGGVRSARLLVIAMFLAGLFSNSILNSRVFFIVLGIIFAMRYAPIHVFREKVSIVGLQAQRPEMIAESI